MVKVCAGAPCLPGVGGHERRPELVTCPSGVAAWCRRTRPGPGCRSRWVDSWVSGLARVGAASRLYPEHRALHRGLGAVLAAILGQLGWPAMWSDAVGALRGGEGTTPRGPRPGSAHGDGGGSSLEEAGGAWRGGPGL